jgi:cytochrome c553
VTRKWVHRLLYGAAALAAASIALAPAAYDRLFPVPTRFASDLEHFKYASVGVEPVSGIPYEIWRALPGLCMSPEQAKRGYKAFGFQWEPGHVAPIGMPVERALVTRVGVNCALCHVGRIEDDQGRSTLLPGAPNTELDVQSYLRFLYGCAASKRFNADAILDEMARHRKVGFAKSLLYRLVIVPQTRKALLKQRREMAFMDGHPLWGPGRAAGFNPAKAQVLHRPYDGTLDTVDFPALWNMDAHQPGALHWDGVNTSLHEIVLNSGIGNGASTATLDLASLDRDEAWVRHVRPAPYPFPIDHALAAQGRAVFERGCAACHGEGGAKLNQVIPIAWVKTDRSRMDAINEDVLQAFRDQFRDTLDYQHFRKTNGYVAAPLDGIWARAPYLHNGSVPTLDALLRTVRPVVFGRGSPRYDQARVGFASDRGRLYDTRLPGNSNQGHLWGTDLPEAERRALLEFLKTL